MSNIITYPTNPNQGQEFTVGQTIKVWDGEKWVNKSFGNHEKRLRQLEETKNLTTVELINGSFEHLYEGDSITSVGFYESGDGGGGQWVKTSDTDTPSQTPVDMDDATLVDSSGSVWGLSNNYSYNAKQIGGESSLPISSQGSESSFNITAIASDNIDQTTSGGSKVNGYKVTHVFGGENTRGGRHGLYSVLVQGPQTATDNPDRNYVAIQGHVIVGNNADGGVVGGYKGAYFGLSSFAQCPASAEGVLNVSGAEINTNVLDGAEVKLKTGVQVVSADTGFGDIDAGYYLSKKGSAIGYDKGFMLSDYNGGFPIPETGDMFYAGSDGVARYTVNNGIWFDRIDFTTSIIRSDNYVLMGSGSTEVGSLSASSIITQDHHTSGNNTDYDYRVQYSGGNATIGNGVALHIGTSIFKGLIRPSENSVYDLGAITYRYDTVYSSKVNISDFMRLAPLSGVPLVTPGSIAVDNGANWSGVNSTGLPRPVFYDGTAWVAMF